MSFILLASSLFHLYSSLDPLSVTQHFAFYELYPETHEGKDALKHAWALLKGDEDPNFLLPQLDLQSLIRFINLSDPNEKEVLNEKQLDILAKLGSQLENRKLKGSSIWNLEEFLKLDDSQIDLARGLLLAQIGNDPIKIRSYEAKLDLMALQIQARLNYNPTDLEKIRAINDFVFSEMRFRFPPHSLYAKDIDLYTFLPSVLDGRRGVCLGVSILYLSLAQRLGLQLEAITPPGHIYVRYKDPNGEILNIETTARGIDIPSEMYLGMETKKLQVRTLKEVIGCAFMNGAAVSWQKNDFEMAVALYEKARPFLEDDYLLNMFLGFNYLFTSKVKEGKHLLNKIKSTIPDHSITKDTITEDYLLGHVDSESIKVIFSEVDEKRQSILEKQEKLKKITEKFPKFRAGWFHLAITYLQLGREKEAIFILEKYLKLHPIDPTANYYLSVLYFQRHNFPVAWKHLKIAEMIVFEKDHSPKALKSLRQALCKSCPEPKSDL